MNIFFVVTAPGLEPLAAAELSKLGLAPTEEPGGVTFRGELPDLYRANLHLRTASRVLARLGGMFYATSFADLRDKAARLPWERFLAPKQPIALRVTCHKSKLIHSDAVAERIHAAIEDRFGKPVSLQKPGGEDAESPPQLVVVRLANDQVTVSIDSSGELLHRRGYRQALAKAPLRETLAAAMLMFSGWDMESPLIDPFCGSGTIPIEAALMAQNIAPGLNRRFAFMDWPGFDLKAWETVKAKSAGAKSSRAPHILASDRDAGAVKSARENAERAGVAHLIEFNCQAVSAIHPPKESGVVVTNPPYGVRVSEGHDLRNLYAQFGNVLREKCPGWTLAALCNDRALLGQVGLKLDTSVSMVNGGIRVMLGRGKVT
jgi:putative N6-adenine-specific DNA methylase